MTAVARKRTRSAERMRKKQAEPGEEDALTRYRARQDLLEILEGYILPESVIPGTTDACKALVFLKIEKEEQRRNENTASPTFIITKPEPVLLHKPYGVALWAQIKNGQSPVELSMESDGFQVKI